MRKKIHRWFWAQIAHLACYLENKSWEQLWKHREFRKNYLKDD